MKKLGSTILPGALLLASLAAFGCRSGKPPQAAPSGASGTKKMAALLDRLVRGADPKKNPFMNGARAEAMRMALQGVTDPKANLEWGGEMALELLNSGKTEEAIQELLRLKEYIGNQGMQAGPRTRHFLYRHLAIAYLRLGEQQNCIFNHSAESCLMPIRGGGIHKLQKGSRAAIDIIKEMLKDDPNDLEARWFLNLAYMTLGEYPSEVPPQWVIPPKAFDSSYEVKRFVDIAGRLGLDVDDLAGGSVVDDFDGDGDLDIMASAQALRGQLRYFRDNGDGTFTERTQEAGLTGEIGGLNLVSTDYNNDGWVDVMVLRGGWMGKGGIYPFSLLRNNGDGTFTDVTEEAGLLRFGPGQSATWLDYDGDGWLDVYVAKETTPGTEVRPCQLFHNNRDGTFTECTATNLAVTGLVKAVASGDYNNDGRPDVYVSRHGDPNLLFRNDGPKGSGASAPCAWSFTDVTAAAGVSEPIYSFPTWFFDYDNDGWLDIFVSGYKFKGAGDVLADYLNLPYDAERPRLYHNQHDGTFRDVTKEAGLYHVAQTMGSNFGDIDNDGWLDIYLGTGDPNLGSLIPNRMFRNAEGKFFQDVTTSAGVGHLQKGHGVSFADFDGDGDQDIYEVMGGAYEGDHYRNVLYENPGYGNHWIKLKLEGVRSNRAAMGARIKVTVETAAGARSIYKTVATGGSFGCSPLRQEIGLGQARSIQSIEVFWPVTGITQTFRNAGMNQAYRIREDQPDLIPLPLKSFTFPATAPPGSASHTHHH